LNQALRNWDIGADGIQLTQDRVQSRNFMITAGNDISHCVEGEEFSYHWSGYQPKTVELLQGVILAVTTSSTEIAASFLIRRKACRL
jgi:hypothetical protein